MTGTMTRTVTRKVTRTVGTRLRAPRLRRSPKTDTPRAESVLRVCGELDFLTVDQLRRRLEAEIARHSHVVLDLTVATFYDHAAFEALDEIRAQARRAGCTLTVNARRRTGPPSQGSTTEREAEETGAVTANAR